MAATLGSAGWKLGVRHLDGGWGRRGFRVAAYRHLQGSVVRGVGPVVWG